MEGEVSAARLPEKGGTALGEGFPFLAPAALLTAVLGVLPLFALLGFSLFDWSLTRPNAAVFVGLGNYAKIVGDPTFWRALGVTVWIAVETIVIQIVCGVGIALLLNRDLPGMGIIRAFIMAPMMMAPLFAGLVWRLAFSSDFGIIPYLLSLLGWEAPPAFLSDPDWALHAVVLVTVWQTTPFVVLFVIAALQIIPKEIYEAARLDGAGPFSLFRSITLPLLRPVLLTVVLFSVIDSVKIFDPIYTLTSGGPGDATESLSYLIYLETSQFFDMGYGSALAVVTLAIVAVPVMSILRNSARASGPARTDEVAA